MVRVIHVVHMQAKSKRKESGAIEQSSSVEWRGGVVESCHPVAGCDEGGVTKNRKRLGDINRSWLWHKRKMNPLPKI
jgi:hypothetical protein